MGKRHLREQSFKDILNEKNRNLCDWIMFVVILPVSIFVIVKIFSSLSHVVRPCIQDDAVPCASSLDCSLGL